MTEEQAQSLVGKTFWHVTTAGAVFREGGDYVSEYRARHDGPKFSIVTGLGQKFSTFEHLYLDEVDAYREAVTFLEREQSNCECRIRDEQRELVIIKGRLEEARAKIGVTSNT